VVAALAVVLVACPCSYSIAAPLVHWLAMRRGLAGGVLVRTAEGLESLAAVRTVAFDKTGTLTGSDPMIQDVRVTAPVEEVRGIVFALEEGSRHPIARALHEWAEGAAPETVSERRFIPGTGVIARDGRGRELALGAPEKLSPGPREDDARVILLRDGEEIAAFSAGESLRPEAAPALEALKRDGLDVLILTGDNEARGEEIGRALGVPVRSGQRPEDKVRAVQEIAGGREGTVAMVGDGLNDAPALAALGPSIAMEGATGLARGVAGVLLLRPDLRLVPWTLSLSRRATQLARRLLIASTVYNLGFVALAMCGALAPVFAGLSMLISSLGTMGLTVAFTAEGQEAPTPAS
jgi:P-type E1-E2 ATPase